MAMGYRHHLFLELRLNLILLLFSNSYNFTGTSLALYLNYVSFFYNRERS